MTDLFVRVRIEAEWSSLCGRYLVVFYSDGERDKACMAVAHEALSRRATRQLAEPAAGRGEEQKP